MKAKIMDDAQIVPNDLLEKIKEKLKRHTDYRDNVIELLLAFFKNSRRYVNNAYTIQKVYQISKSVFRNKLLRSILDPKHMVRYIHLPIQRHL